MKDQTEIRWGILGCGDVCEVKSGPAFNKADHSKLTAVMRRDAEKAKDFARRHHVPKYYTDAGQLIADDDVNAIYIATPPAFHEEYAIQAMKAGKPVYIEKPVTLNSASCERLLKVSQQLGVKASVAHYRRGLPIFKTIKSILQSGKIGQATLMLARTLLPAGEKTAPRDNWRINPEISGGGLFFDLAPHQLDIFYWLFGKPVQTRGFSMNQKNAYNAPDLTTIEAVYEGGACLQGIWAFNLNPEFKEERCVIFGERGKIKFSFFEAGDLEVTTSEGTEKTKVENPENIQFPMICDVIRYFRDEGPNPCSLSDALLVMQMMDTTTRP